MPTPLDPILRIRDAVVAGLNAAAQAAPLSYGFEAQAARVVDVNLAENYDGLDVPVIATRVASAGADRDGDRDKIRIEVGVLKRPSKADDFAEVDQLVGFVSQLRNAVRGLTLADFDSDFDPPTVDPLYDHDQLLKNGVFVAVIATHYFATYPEDYEGDE